MERARLSTATGKGRPLLAAARARMHFSLEEVAEQLGVSKSTVHRWEKKGDVPQPYHIRKLCELYRVTARELGFEEPYTIEVQTITEAPEAIEEEGEVSAFRRQHLISRLMSLVWNWLPGDARYQRLQLLLMLELEDNSMNNEMSRRDALRFLALVPVDMLGLSQFHAVFKGSHEDILKHCAAGIVACGHLRKGKELVFADGAISKYIPTLKVMAQTAPTIQKNAAADLVAQCLLLKSLLAWHLMTPNDALIYAQQAETYGNIAGSRLLQITALRTQAAAQYFANQWKQALQTFTVHWFKIKQSKSLNKFKLCEIIQRLCTDY